MRGRDSARVSVVLAVYNGERYLAEALNSIFAQDPRPFEVIVVDDGSRDRSAEIASSYDGVEVIRQANRGTGAARNRGIRRSRGEWIAFLDQDDLWTPDKLRVQLAFMRRHPELPLTFARQRSFLEAGARLPGTLIRNWVRRQLETEEVAGYLPGTLVVRRSFFDEAGLFDPSYRVSSDAEWFFRVADRGVPLTVVPQVLLLKRFHENNHCYETQTSRHELLRIARSSIRRKTAGPGEPLPDGAGG